MDEQKWRFKRPRLCDFKNYCGECSKFSIIRVAGCAQIGTCPEFNRVDAERQSCVFFEKGGKRWQSFPPQQWST